MGKFKKNVVTKMKCKVCNSKNINYINYDNHILDLSFKGILKFIIPNFNLVPMHQQNDKGSYIRALYIKI